MSKRYFITGIGTGVGKTLVSAVMAEALQADYIKPVQCGSLHYTDSDFVRDHLFNSRSVVHPESVLLRLAASPHTAAAAEGKTLALSRIALPVTENNLLVEGAGGLLVPLNEKKDYVIDIARMHKLGVVLVADYYLGSINHTLLSLAYLKKAKIPVNLLVFNGDKVEASKRAILNEAGDIPCVEIDRFEVSPNGVKEKADMLAEKLRSVLLA